MSYYEIRRRELLGDRQRKPRRCDIQRAGAMQRSQTRRKARMVAAMNRLESVL